MIVLEFLWFLFLQLIGEIVGYIALDALIQAILWPFRKLGQLILSLLKAADRLFTG